MKLNLVPNIDNKLYLFMNGTHEKEVINCIYHLVTKSHIEKDSTEFIAIIDAINHGANEITVYYIDKLHESFMTSIDFKELSRSEKREVALELYKVSKYRQSDIAVMLGMSTSGINRLITKNR